MIYIGMAIGYTATADKSIYATVCTCTRLLVGSTKQLYYIFKVAVLFLVTQTKAFYSRCLGHVHGLDTHAVLEL